jgi:hypothetical protein
MPRTAPDVQGLMPLLGTDPNVQGLSPTRDAAQAEARRAARPMAKPNPYRHPDGTEGVGCMSVRPCG